MTRGGRAIAALLAVMWLTRPRRARRRSAQAAPNTSGAWAIMDWPGGAVVTGEQLARLRQPTEPGSFLKIATLVAAFATGLASA